MDILPLAAEDLAGRMREMAAEARAIAEEMTDPESKRSMLEIAAGYEVLANEGEPPAQPVKVAAA
jgi:hypothetical protein